MHMYQYTLIFLSPKFISIIFKLAKFHLRSNFSYGAIVKNEGKDTFVPGIWFWKNMLKVYKKQCASLLIQTYCTSKGKNMSFILWQKESFPPRKISRISSLNLVFVIANLWSYKKAYTLHVTYCTIYNSQLS